jgi:hypothetical protein
MQKTRFYKCFLSETDLEMILSGTTTPSVEGSDLDSIRRRRSIHGSVLLGGKRKCAIGKTTSEVRNKILINK